MLYVLFWIYFSYPEYNYTTVIRTLFVLPHRAKQEIYAESNSLIHIIIIILQHIKKVSVVFC